MIDFKTLENYRHLVDVLRAARRSSKWKAVDDRPKLARLLVLYNLLDEEEQAIVESEGWRAWPAEYDERIGRGDGLDGLDSDPAWLDGDDRAGGRRATAMSNERDPSERYRVEYDFHRPAPYWRLITVFNPETGPYEGWIVRLDGTSCPATKVRRARNGGTTVIECHFGRLHVPARGQATWTPNNGGPNEPLIDGELAPTYQRAMSATSSAGSTPAPKVGAKDDF